jgi:SAM-dependent methyltransferase
VNAPPPGAKVLDFGCGDGRFLNAFQARGWDTYGVEPSTAVAFARHRRLESVPRDASFDLVFLHHVLEHLPHPLALLRELAAALREGGALFVSVPSVETLPEHGDFRYCLNARTHLCCFSGACLEHLLARARFAPVGRLESAELDALFTRGRPMRLRMVARRMATAPSPAGSPLEPAVTALRRYHWRHGNAAARAQQLLPVRMRGALMDRAREKSRGARGRE